MANISWQRYLIWILEANLAIWIVNVLVFAFLVLSGSDWTTLVFSRYFSKITLLETGVSFLVGGAFAFSGSVLSSKAKEYILKSDELWTIKKLEKSEKKANKYIILAIVLFVECIVISFFGA